MTAFDHITDFYTLCNAWERVRSNGGGPGGDGVRIEQFAKRAPHHLAKLGKSVRENTYLPGPAKRVRIPKKSGGFRELSIPTVADRIIQSAASQWLSRQFDSEMEDSSFGYRPGRSVQMAVERVVSLRRQGYVWVVDGDIERFFDNVPHDLLLDRLASFEVEQRLIDLIGLWLEHLGTMGRGLPQGSPISPVLSNLYLDEIDERIESHGVRLVRFADDFLLLCKKERTARKALLRMGALLEAHGLKIHPDKTRVVPFEQSFAFLGHLFVRSMVVEDSKWDDVIEKSAAVPVACDTYNPDHADDDDDRLGDRPGFDNAVRTCYIITPGSRLNSRQSAFLISRQGSTVALVPSRHLDRIEIHDGASFSNSAVRLAARQSVNVAIVGGHGETLAELDTWRTEKTRLHLAQAAHRLDDALRVALARQFVHARLFNERALLRRLNRRKKIPEVAAVCHCITRVIRTIKEDKDIQTLMGREGNTTKMFYGGLKLLLREGWVFDSRTRRPPRDPTNALLSFTSWLLMRDVSNLVQRSGLHPGIGILHGARDAHPGCAADLIEEFRAPLAEGLCAYLINNRIIDLEDFTMTEDECKLSSAATSTLVRHYEAWLNRPIKSATMGRKVSWKKLVGEQVRQFTLHLQARTQYQPYLMKY